MRLILVLHHHQPLGQLPWAVSDAVHQCYVPLLKVLLRHPSINVALHYSGPLLEMLRAEYPEILDDIKVLLQRGQIELLGGAWWESILPIWPVEDQIAQLQLTRERLKVLFDVEPQGAWLPERVWENELSHTLIESGYRWTLLDDNALQNAGVASQDLYRMQRTAAGLNVLSIDAHLRQLIPWQDISEIVDYLSALHQKDPNAICVYADDAEKFGGWPGTFQLIYEENYLEDLLATLEKNNNLLQTVLPSSCDDAPLNPVDIPPASYPEMLEWSGGNWRHFLVRYHERRDIYDTVWRPPRIAHT
jgi:alpha-amylase